MRKQLYINLGFHLGFRVIRDFLRLTQLLLPWLRIKIGLTH